MNIRKATPADAVCLAALVQLQPAAAQWTAAQFESELGLTCAQSWCAQEQDSCVGFISLRTAAGEGEILNLAVHPQYARRGIGRQLLAQALEALKAQGNTHISLEAAEHNTAANQLYAQAGFQRCVKRKNFYAEGQDAWIWEKNL